MHRELLLCQLDMACDPAPLLERYLRGRPEDDSEGEGVSWDGYESMDDVDPQRLLAAGADTLQVLGRGRAWRGSVEAVDGHFINFFDRLAEVSERGLFQAPLMVDEVHLSAEGYWFLASLCSAEILAMQGEAIPDDLRVTGRNPTVPERYREGELDVLLHHGLFHLRKRMPYLAGGILRMAVERHGSAEARRRLAWMREALGGEPMLPPEHGVVPTTAELEETCRSEPGCW